MRLKTKLVLAATSVTFAIVIVLSVVFVLELLRQRVLQTAASNEVMARQVLMMTKQAVEAGLKAHPPVDHSEEAVQAAVADALRSYDGLTDTMRSFVLYSPSVQDVSVTDAHGYTLVSTDPLMFNQLAAVRRSFERMQDEGIIDQLREVFGQPLVLDVAEPLDRNGKPFLMVHIGVRSTFLKNNYVPWLKDAFWLALIIGLISVVASGLLANLALRPIEEISHRLNVLTGGVPEVDYPGRLGLAGAVGLRTDAVVRVTNTIDRLGEQIKSTEAGYTDLQSNLEQMLDTLRDGVVLFTGERRAVMVSDAVAHFVETKGERLVGRTLKEIFGEDTALGKAVLKAFDRGTNVASQTVRMEDGREVEISLDWIDDVRAEEVRGRVIGSSAMGTLLTLRDKGSAIKLEQELEVSRRLAAVGRLTSGVGHEVKNPINAMVVHLELLRSKLEIAGEGRQFLGPVMRHVDILAGEMERLDRVVQALADFTRPIELDLRETQLGDVVDMVVELTGAEMAEHQVEVMCRLEPAVVRADGEMLRQALLNLMLNGMQAMQAGGRLRVRVRRERDEAVIEVADEGEGIPRDVLPKIFDLYFTTKAKGSGIGLAMTYRIVQMHGGSMDVQSEPGKGAVFSIRLPMSVEAALVGRGPARLRA